MNKINKRKKSIKDFTKNPIWDKIPFLFIRELVLKKYEIPIDSNLEENKRNDIINIFININKYFKNAAKEGEIFGKSRIPEDIKTLKELFSSKKIKCKGDFNKLNETDIDLLFIWIDSFFNPNETVKPSKKNEKEKTPVTPFPIDPITEREEIEENEEILNGELYRMNLSLFELLSFNIRSKNYNDLNVEEIFFYNNFSKNLIDKYYIRAQIKNKINIANK